MKNTSCLTPVARLFQWVSAHLATCALMLSPPVLASNVANVNIGDFFFSPTAVTINVNDQVRWTWIGSIGHTTTSDTGLWDSGINGNGATFVNTFTTAGRFPYHCTVHPFMMGAITVQAANVTLSGIQRLSPTSFQFSYSAAAGLPYVVQRSGDLTHWTALATNVAKSGSESFLDQSATGNPQFYRVGRLPNP
jgi:plastocyanin